MSLELPEEIYSSINVTKGSSPIQLQQVIEEEDAHDQTNSLSSKNDHEDVII